MNGGNWAMKWDGIQAEKEFLAAFSAEWQHTLEAYDCPQDQMNDGSRLRPLMTLWGYLAAIGDSAPDFPYIARVSVSVELLHKATVILDDWIDGDNARHGLTAFHVSYSPELTAILALHMISDAILRFRDFTPAFPPMPDFYSHCAELITQTIYAMSQGALMELKLGDNLFDLEHIKHIAHLETAEILGNSMQLGYYSGRGNEPTVSELFKSIGDRFGYLFQAMNDLEAFADAEALAIHKGHVNNDFSVSRKNIAVATLYNVATAQDQQQIKLRNPSELAQLMKKYHITQFIEDETEGFYRSLHRSLQEFQPELLNPDWVSQFEVFIQKMKLRAYKKLGIFKVRSDT